MGSQAPLQPTNPLQSQTVGSLGMQSGTGNIGSQPTQSLAAPQTSFNLTPSTTQQSGLSFGLQSSLSFGSQPQTLSTGQFNSTVGTGTPSWTISGTSGTTSGAGGTPAPPFKVGKEDQIPQEMALLVQGFKAFVAEQKNCSSEVARSNLKPIVKVSEDTDALMKQCVVKLKRIVGRNNRLNVKLKADTVRGLSDCELAQDMSGVFQNSDSSLPVDSFFSRLAERFKEQVVSFKLQIENTEKHLLSVLNPTALTPQELYVSMQRLHDSFVALAGRLQFIHSSITALKQRQLELRKRKLNDFTNIFDKRGIRKDKFNNALLPVASPTPFSGQRNYHTINMMASQAKMMQSLSKTHGADHLLLNQPQRSSSSSLFYQSSMVAPDLGSSTNFQLKPPPGNKRGKR